MSDLTEKISRRESFARAGLIAGATLTSAMSSTSAATSGKHGNFIFCLNTSTIRGHRLGIEGELELAAKAGYRAVEPWLLPINDYVKQGKSLKDLRKRVDDLGLTLESAIAFAPWIVDDDAARAKGLEQAKQDMDMIAQLGGKRIAAPPAGATKEPLLDLRKVAERYRALLELGDQMGVVPELEFWGPSLNLKKLSEAMFCAMETGHPKACLLADVYHLYKGGSSIDTLHLASGSAIVVLHMNDYPAEPAHRQDRRQFPHLSRRRHRAARRRSSARCTTTADTPCFPWNSSTGTTGGRTPSRSPRRGWRR